MSIHVTVTGNPVCVNRSKVFLSDIELAKKNEWNRRRKLRLQQVRQQSRDLAGKVRRKVKAELQTLEKSEDEKLQSKEKDWRDHQLDHLKREFNKCLKSVGSAHQSAALQPDPDAILKEQKEIMQAVARARGALAEEKSKTEKTISKDKENKYLQTKAFVRQVENARSKMVSSLPPPKETKVQEKYQPSKGKSPPRPRPILKHTSPSKRAKLSSKNDVNLNSSPRKPLKDVQPCSGSDPVLVDRPDSSLNKAGKPSSQRRNVTVADFGCDSDESDDSNTSWPSRSLEASIPPSSPPKVKLYDHNIRKCTEYFKPSSGVLHLANTTNDMRKEIDEHEAAIAEHITTTEERLKKLEERGKQALQTEQTKKEIDKILDDIATLEKKEKIQSVSCPPDMLQGPLKNQYRIDQLLRELDDSDSDFADSNENKKDKTVKSKSDSIQLRRNIQVKGQINSSKSLSTSKEVQHNKTEQGLSELYNRLQRERAKMLHPNSMKKSVQNDSSDEDIEIPHWMHSSFGNDTQKPLHTHNRPQVSKQGENSEKLKKSNVHWCDEGVSADNEVTPPRRISSDARVVKKSLENDDPSPSKDSADSKADESSSGGMETHCFSPNKDTVTVRVEQIPKRNSKSPRKKRLLVSSDSSLQKESSDSSPETSPYVSSRYRMEEVGLEEGMQLSTSQKESLSGKAEKNSSSQDLKPSTSQEHKIPEKVTNNSSSDPSSPAQIDDTSSSVDGIKIVVKVSGKPKNEERSKRHETKSKNVTSSDPNRNCGKVRQGEHVYTSSSSYCSPPDKLSPEQQNRLGKVLERLFLKNKNPTLHNYIIDLLNKSHQNVTEIAGSTVSDVTVPSDICNSTETSQLPSPKHHSPKKRLFYPAASDDSPGKSSTSSNHCLEETVQSSLRGSSISFAHTESSINSILSSDLADCFSKRLDKLTEMVDNCNLLFVNEPSEHSVNTVDETTSHFGLPKKVDHMENKYPSTSSRFSFPDDSVGTGKDNYLEPYSQQLLQFLTNPGTSSLGLPVGLYPRPFESQSDEQSQQETKPEKTKPPSSLMSRRLKELKAHELSTIQEADTPISFKEEISIPDSSQKVSSLLEHRKLEPILSASESDHLVKSKLGEKLNGSSSYILPEPVPGPSGIVCSVTKKAFQDSGTSFSDLSSNEFLTEKDFSSAFESSTEGIEEVFKSLGIGWALSTLRKTRERNKLKLESSSSTGHGDQSRERNSSTKSRTNRSRSNSSIKHSTPIKQTRSSTSRSTKRSPEKRKSKPSPQSDNLTPPSFSLNNPFLKR